MPLTGFGKQQDGGGGSQVSYAALARGPPSTQSIDDTGARADLDNIVFEDGATVNLTDNTIEVDNPGNYIVMARIEAANVHDEDFIRLDIEGMGNPTQDSVVARPSHVSSEFYSYTVNGSTTASMGTGRAVYAFVDCWSTIDLQTISLGILGFDRS